VTPLPPPERQHHHVRVGHTHEVCALPVAAEALELHDVLDELVGAARVILVGVDSASTELPPTQP
jgi:hypothetical protein